MLSTEQFESLRKQLVQLTASVQAVAIALLGGQKAVLDGTISDPEHLANLEGWEIVKIFEKANSLALRKENEQAHGFENLPPLTPATLPDGPGPSSPLGQVLGEVLEQ